MDGAMTENMKDKKENRKPPPDYVGGNRNQIVESNIQGEQVIGL